MNTLGPSVLRDFQHAKSFHVRSAKICLHEHSLFQASQF